MVGVMHRPVKWLSGQLCVGERAYLKMEASTTSTLFQCWQPRADPHIIPPTISGRNLGQKQVGFEP